MKAHAAYPYNWLMLKKQSHQEELSPLPATRSHNYDKIRWVCKGSQSSYDGKQHRSKFSKACYPLAIEFRAKSLTISNPKLEKVFKSPIIKVENKG